MNLMDFFKGNSMKLVSSREVEAWAVEYSMVRSGLSLNIDELEVAELLVWMKWMEIENKEIEKEMRRWQKNLY